MRSTFVLATSLLAASLAFGQGNTVAELKDVKGNVLVGNEAGAASATDGQKVATKSSITTGARAGVVVVFDNGCRVTLTENQNLVVNAESACEALIASVQPVPPPSAPLGAPVAAGAGGLSGTTLAIVGGVAVGALIYDRCRNKPSKSGRCG